MIRKQLNLPIFKVLKESESYDSENIKPCDYEHPVFFSKFYQFVKEGHIIGKAEPLFKRIAEADVKVWKEKFGGVQEKKPEDDPKNKKKEKPKAVKTENPENGNQAEKKTEKKAEKKVEQKTEHKTPEEKKAEADAKKALAEARKAEGLAKKALSDAQKEANKEN